MATLFQRSYSRFHEFTNSAKGSQSDKDRNDRWEKKPYSVNSATNGLENLKNTFSIISIVEFNARFITFFWAHHRTKATNETFFKVTILGTNTSCDVMRAKFKFYGHVIYEYLALWWHFKVGFIYTFWFPLFLTSSTLE